MEIIITVVIFFILSRIGKQNRLAKGQNHSEERVPERRTPTPNKPVRAKRRERGSDRQPETIVTMKLLIRKVSRTESDVVVITSREPLPEWSGLNVPTAERKISFRQEAASIIIVISAGKNYRRG